ncbi:MAG TPA: PQQ-binding-like beta-propeller repeat protein [Pyrinomonadaceae bacterium]
MKSAPKAIRTSLLLLLTCASAPAQAPQHGHWPQWRGPFFNGMARGDAPTTWSDTINVKWKTEIPGKGHSTPVVWGDRIFLTTAIPTGKPASTAPTPAPDVQGEGRRGRGAGGDTAPQPEQRFEVLCLDRKTGKILWQKTAKVAAPHEGYHRVYGSFASNSPVTDGEHVYAFFGSRGLYAYDFSGKLVWQKDFGVQMKIKLGFGEGIAPLLDGNRLFLVFDHEAGSFMVALDKRNGKELWRVTRDELTSWSTPLAIEHAGRRQVVVAATKKVRSYDPETGKVIWEVAGLGGNVVPAPVYQNGIVFVMSGFRDPRLMAIKLGKEGDLTGTDSVLWSQTRGLAYTTSPVLHDNKLFFVTDNGLISAYNGTTGEAFFAQTRLPKTYNFKASPVGANGKLYLATEDGDVVVLRMGEKLEVIATNTLSDQVFIASPVIAQGDLLLRSQNTLFCISGK